jgi:RNA 2',3'-cyclic 3'-phosphodiesterase
MRESPSSRIELGGIGSFPRESDPRVVWIGVRVGFDLLQSVHQQLLHRLATVKIPVDHKPFRAHLTVGYRRKIAPRHIVRETVTTLRRELDAARWAIPLQHVTLYESTLTATGAVHRALGNGPVHESMDGPVHDPETPVADGYS